MNKKIIVCVSDKRKKFVTKWRNYSEYSEEKNRYYKSISAIEYTWKLKKKIHYD